MNRVEKAIEAGRCAIAVGGSLLRDPEVMLALTRRAVLTPMALAGPAVAPVMPVSADGVARALAQPGGVVVLIEPEGADVQGLKQLDELISRARHRPDVIVVSRSYNPFAFGGALSGLRIDHEKGRGKAFIQGLPEGEAAEPPPGAAEAPKLAKPKKDEGIAAPRFCFVGRDEEVDSLAEALGSGGPIVVSGPRGVGRTQLIEHAIKKAGLTRLPDVWLGWGTAHDSLVNRIATMAYLVGDARLSDLLKGDHDSGRVTRAAVEALSDPTHAGKVLVVHNLEYGLGRENDFFRRSRLELLLIALLTNPLNLPVIFVSTRQPRFHREGEGQALRRVEVGGLKGRFLHEIFDAHKAIEFPREKFGPINERIHGHPMAARTMAIATRIRKEGADIVDDPKFMAAESIEDLTPLGKQLSKRVEKLPDPLRKVLARLAHLRIPVDAGLLTGELGVSRKDRLELLSLGLLDMTGTEEDRRYRVHPLVKAQLSWREVSDFDVCEKLADMFASLARKAEGIDRLVLEQEQNRFAVAGRSLRMRPQLDLPDHDMWLESVTGMLRAKNARLDLVEQRLNEALKQNPHNADAWLLKLELAQHAEGGEKAHAQFDEIFEEAIVKAPVPELFQQVVSWLLSRRQRARAVTVLEKGVEVFPEESRLHTRLAAVLQRQGRRNEALDHLKRAMEIDPMLPDSYGLLGMARRDEGLEALADAEQLLREAVRLAPEDPVQISRLADLLVDRARVEPDAAATLRAEARLLLEEAIKGERRAPEACLLFATLVREEGGDLERASWLLGQAKKVTDRGHERARRIIVERALIDLARGDLDSAEMALRQQIGRDPGYAKAFAALGHVLEARDQLIPAHAEYARAKERTSQVSLEAVFYDQQIQRVQGIIEAQAAGLYDVEVAAEPVPQPAIPSTRVLRRRHADGTLMDEGEAAAAEAAEAVEAALAPAAEAAPAGEAPPSSSVAEAPAAEETPPAEASAPAEPPPAVEESAPAEPPPAVEEPPPAESPEIEEPASEAPAVEAPPPVDAPAGIEASPGQAEEQPGEEPATAPLSEQRTGEGPA
jgi:tetratricopeptide (TPR) repeat protein